MGDADGSMCEFSKTCLFNQVASQDNSSNTFWVARFLATDPACSWIYKQLEQTLMFDDKCLLLPLAVHHRGIREVQHSCFKIKLASLLEY